MNGRMTAKLVFDLIVKLAMGVMLTATAAAQNSFYVSTEGGDANPCTKALPCASINRGISRLSHGDTLVVAGGKYKESITCLKGATDSQCIPSGIDADHPTVITASPGERVIVRPKPKREPLRVLTLAGPELNHIVIQGLVLDGVNVQNAVVKITDGANHIRLNNCEIMNSPTSHGVLITDGSGDSVNNEIINCIIHDNGFGWTGPISPPHNIYNSSDDTVIDGCNLYNNAHGFAIHHFSGGERMIVRNCTIHDTGGDGILADGSGDQIYNNLFYNNGSDLKISDGSGLISGIKVYNNTFYNSAEAIKVGVMTLGTSAQNCEIVNNICWAAKDQSWQIRITADALGTILRNNLTRNKISDAGVVTDAKGNLIGDPAFMSPDTRDFRLKDGSPAIDAGVSLPALTKDRDGENRPRGRAYDIGAFESSAAPGTIPNDTQEQRPKRLSSALAAGVAIMIISLMFLLRRRSYGLSR